MKRGQIPYRIYFLGGLIFLAISTLAFRLWYVQIARGAEYTACLLYTSDAADEL